MDDLYNFKPFADIIYLWLNVSFLQKHEIAMVLLRRIELQNAMIKMYWRYGV